MANQKQIKTLVEEKLAVSLFLESLLREPVEEKLDELDTQVETLQDIQQQEVMVEAVAVSTEKEKAGSDMQVLLFRVSGLKLAVPLGELSGVIEWDEEKITEMPGHADFYLGLLQHLGHKIPVIDTARMVFPANKLHELAGKHPRQRVRHIILIDNYQWGLACDDVNDVLTLHHDQVHWRQHGGRRPWLAGTVIEQMCALLNCASFSDMLRTGKKDR